jgi:hypothetical protein
VVTTPIALILSLIGVVRDKSKAPAIVGLVISGLVSALMVFGMVMAAMW